MHILETGVDQMGPTCLEFLIWFKCDFRCIANLSLGLHGKSNQGTS